MTANEQAQDITYALATSPSFSEDGICFAARSSGLYRSGDGGDTWTMAYESLHLEASLATLAVAVSADFGSDRSVFAGVPGGILRSVDGGEGWYISTLPTPPPLVSSLVISPNYAEDGIVMAGTLGAGVYRSADRGRRWASWNFGLLDLGVLCLVMSPGFEHDETLLVGTETGIFRSTNGGRAWRELGFGTDLAPVLSLAVTPNRAEGGTIFAGTESCGLYRSVDEGRTWDRVGESVVTESVNGIILSPDFPAKQDTMVILNDTLLVSRDGGETWASLTADGSLDSGVVSVAAPEGLDPGAPLLVGLAEDGVLQLTLPKSSRK